MKLALSFVALLLVLTGCASKPPADLYVLRAPTSLDFSSCLSPRGAITIARPSAPQEYDSKRIAVLLDAQHLNYYSGANWASPLPDQLQQFLVDALSQSDRFVTTAGDSANQGSIVSITIHQADVVRVKSPVVRLRLTGVVRDASSHRVIAPFSVNETVPASENHMAQIIAAYDEAASHAAQQIAQALKLRCTN